MDLSLRMENIMPVIPFQGIIVHMIVAKYFPEFAAFLNFQSKMHRIYEKYEIYRIKHDPTSTIGRFNPGYTVDWSPSILCIFNSIRCQLQSHRDHWKIIHSLLSMTKVELSVRITRSKYYSKKKFIRNNDWKK